MVAKLVPSVTVDSTSDVLTELTLVDAASVLLVSAVVLVLLVSVAFALRNPDVSNVNPPPPPLVPIVVRVLVYALYELTMSGTYGPTVLVLSAMLRRLLPVGMGRKEVRVMLKEVRSDWMLLTREAMEGRSAVAGSVKASAVAVKASM